MAHSPEPGGLHGPDQTPLGGWLGVGAGQGAESNTFLKFRLFFSLFDKRKRGVWGGSKFEESLNPSKMQIFHLTAGGRARRPPSTARVPARRC